MWERIGIILRKELIQALREPRMRVLLFLPPMIQLLVFGFAVNLDVDHARIAWMDMDRTPASRDLRERFEGSGRFDVVALPRSEEEVQHVLDRGEAQAVVRVLPEFERDVKRGRAHRGAGAGGRHQFQHGVAGVELRGRGDRGVFERRRGRRRQERARAGAQPGRGRQHQLRRGDGAHAACGSTPTCTAATTSCRAWCQHHHDGDADADGAGHRARKRDRHHGAVDGDADAPHRADAGQDAAIRAGGHGGRGADHDGGAAGISHSVSRQLRCCCCSARVLFLMTTLGAGLLLSTISQTQQQAMMGNFFFTTPAFMLSGFAFPIRNMPVAVQYLTYLNPLRYFMEIVRGIFLKGTGLAVLWPQMACLAVYGVTVLGLSAVRFHKKLD